MVTEEYISGETLDEKLHRQGVMAPEFVKYYILRFQELSCLHSDFAYVSLQYQNPVILQLHP